jgi:hypothetical protein
MVPVARLDGLARGMHNEDKWSMQHWTAAKARLVEWAGAKGVGPRPFQILISFSFIIFQMGLCTMKKFKFRMILFTKKTNGTTSIQKKLCNDMNATNMNFYIRKFLFL